MRLPLVLVSVITTVECARILGIFALPFYSHFKLGETLFKELVDRGHEVTVISSFPRKEPIKNYRDVAINDMNEVMESKLDRTATGLYSQYMEQSTFATTIDAHELFTICTDASLQSENVQTFLRSNETFDLIILQQFFNEAYLGFMHRFKAPVVLFSSISPSLWTGTVMGSPVPFAYMPYVYVDYPPKMNFWQRMHNCFAHTFDILYKEFIYLPRQNEILHRSFPEAPPLEDLMYNASLMLVNHHSTSGAAIPLQPNIIEIGGFHVQNYQPLSGSLQKFLDEANEGVVYFSLGSFVRSDSLPEEQIKGILNAEMFERFRFAEKHLCKS